MAVIGTVQALFQSDTKQWSAGANKAISDLDKVEHRSDDFFKNLKHNFGRRSELGEAFELLKGAGAIAGIGLALRDMDEMSKKARELSDQLREGKISEGEFFGKMAEDIPLIGSMVSTGANLREMFTGEQFAQNKLNERMKEAVKIGDEQTKSAAELKKMLLEASAEQLKIQMEIKAINATPLEKKKIEADIKASGEEKTTDDKRKAALAQFDEKTKALEKQNQAGKRLQELHIKLSAAQSRFYAAAEDTELGKGQRIDAQNSIDHLKGLIAKVEPAFHDMQQQRHKQRLAIEAQFTANTNAEKDKATAEAIQLDKEHSAEVDKAFAEEAKKLGDAQAKEKIAAMRTAGDEIGAATLEIQKRITDEQEQNMVEAHAKLKELSIKENSDKGKEMLAAVTKRNNALSDAGRAEVAARKKEVDESRKAKHDSVMGHGDTELEHMQAEAAELKTALDKKLITQEEYTTKVAELHKKFTDSLGQSKEQEPFEAYRKDLEKYGQALRAKLITLDQFKAHVAETQQELRKAQTPEHKDAENQVRRFNFGRLSTPKMAGPFADMVKVSTDSKTILAGIKDAITQGNKVIKDALAPETVSIKK